MVCLAGVAAGERAEGWQHQALGFGVVNKTGQAQPVAAAADRCHRMQVAAELQQRTSAWRQGFRTVAEPEGPAPTAGLLHQPFEPAAPFVVAGDQGERTAEQLRQGLDLLAQLTGEAEPSVDKITQHQHLAWLPAVRQRDQGVEGGGIAITGQWHAMSLKQLGLAQVQIRHQQQALERIPHRLRSQELKPVAAPEEGKVFAQRVLGAALLLMCSI